MKGRNRRHNITPKYRRKPVSYTHLDFHDVIFQATENDKLIQMFRNLRIQLYRYRMAQAKNDNSMSTIVAHHRSILRALENHDSEEGAAVAQGHIKYQTESILRFIKNK